MKFSPHVPLATTYAAGAAFLLITIAAYGPEPYVLPETHPAHGDRPAARACHGRRPGRWAPGSQGCTCRVVQPYARVQRVLVGQPIGARLAELLETTRWYAPGAAVTEQPVMASAGRGERRRPVLKLRILRWPSGCASSVKTDEGGVPLCRQSAPPGGWSSWPGRRASPSWFHTRHRSWIDRPPRPARERSSQPHKGSLSYVEIHFRPLLTHGATSRTSDQSPWVTTGITPIGQTVPGCRPR